MGLIIESRYVATCSKGFVDTSNTEKVEKSIPLPFATSTVQMYSCPSFGLLYMCTLSLFHSGSQIFIPKSVSALISVLPVPKNELPYSCSNCASEVFAMVCFFHSSSLSGTSYQFIIKCCIPIVRVLQTRISYETYYPHHLQ